MNAINHWEIGIADETFYIPITAKENKEIIEELSTIRKKLSDARIPGALIPVQSYNKEELGDKCISIISQAKMLLKIIDDDILDIENINEKLRKPDQDEYGLSVQSISEIADGISEKAGLIKKEARTVQEVYHLVSEIKEAKYFDSVDELIASLKEIPAKELVN